MKTTLLTHIGVVLVMAVNAQNWEILNTNKTYFYRHSDSLHIGNTIHIDSISSNESFESYYTAYKYKECDTCTVYPDGMDEWSTTLIYRYATEFLGFEVVKDIINDNYILDDKVFKHHSTVGETWEFTADITATTISLGQAILFGEMDSVKTIVLSTNDTIILSQNKGLIRYPDFENEGKYYELGGYHEGQNSYGEYAPNFWSTYDFEVGNRYCYFRSDAQYSSDPVSESFSCQYDILNVQVGGDSISFDVIKKCIISNSANGVSYQNYEYNISYPNLVTSSENVFGVSRAIQTTEGVDVNFDEYPFFLIGWDYDNGSDYFFVPQIAYTNQLGVIKKVKRYSAFGDSLLFSVDFYCYPESIYLPIINQFTNGDEMIFANYAGLIGMSQSYGFGACISYELVGAVISNDTIDDFCDFPIDLGIENISINPLSIHPNPATNQITIEGIYQTLEIFSQTGQSVLKLEKPTAIIDVSNLSSGIYFLKATNEEKLYTTKLIVE